jgi:hypothetical protein
VRPDAAKDTLAAADVIAAEVEAGPHSELGLALTRVRGLLDHEERSVAESSKTG